MGEYIYYRGQHVKLGTCEDLYYARITDIQEITGKAGKLEGNLAPAEYLKESNGFRYRFPFPEEDGVKIGDYSEYDKGLFIYLSAHLSPNLIQDLPTWDHGEICYHASYKGAAGVNLFIPCPLSAHPGKTSLGGASKAVVIEQQKQVSGELWVVVACPYCGAKVRLEKESAQELAACVREMDKNNKGYWDTVADRILAGYH